MWVSSKSIGFACIANGEYHGDNGENQDGTYGNGSIPRIPIFLGMNRYKSS